jgi:HCOMODA/2-hydroxy-3-carboxy-muconic semialdehyde decarboxylase
MRGHGMTVVGPNVRQAVYRAIYTKKAAEIELQALALSGDVKYLSDKEAANFSKRLARMGDADFQPLRPWPIWEAHAKARIREMFGAAR